MWTVNLIVWCLKRKLKSTIGSVYLCTVSVAKCSRSLTCSNTYKIRNNAIVYVRLIVSIFSAQDQRSYSNPMRTTYFKPAIVPCKFKKTLYSHTLSHTLKSHILLLYFSLCTYYKFNFALYDSKLKITEELNVRRNMSLKIKIVVVFRKLVTCLLFSRPLTLDLLFFL